MSQVNDYKEQLAVEREKARGNRKNSQGEKDAKASLSPSPKNLKKNIFSAVSLISFIESRDIFFLLAITMAMLKDIFDVGLIGMIATPLILIITIVAMFVCGSNNFFGKKKATTLLLGNLFEILPGLNFLPLETLSTILIYIFLLQERKEAHQKQKERVALAGEYA